MHHLFTHSKKKSSSPGLENYAGAPPPPLSGYRLPLVTESPFPPLFETGSPPFHDVDRSPIFIGSAVFPNAVHPCKVAPALSPPCRVPYGGGEYEHHGRYDLLPFDESLMEWVQTNDGHIPHGRRPIYGGYEENGSQLYHGRAVVQGILVPGKTAPHLGGCNVAFGGGEHVVKNHYEILCWRD